MSGGGRKKELRCTVMVMGPKSALQIAVALAIHPYRPAKAMGSSRGTVKLLCRVQWRSDGWEGDYMVEKRSAGGSVEDTCSAV